MLSNAALQLIVVAQARRWSDHRGVDLISDVLPFGRLWYGEPNAIRFRDQKLPPPTPTGVKGGCSPQNNRGKLARPMPTKFTWETAACVGFAMSHLLTVVYRKSTRCPLSRMLATCSRGTSTRAISKSGESTFSCRRLMNARPARMEERSLPLSR